MQARLFWPFRTSYSGTYSNHLLTEREGRTGKYWPDLSWQYRPSSARSVEKRPSANIPQYGSS